MQLGNQVEWAIHSVSTLASLEPGQRLSAATLAEMFEVPPKYLAKALQSLAAAKIVETTPGPRGGYALGREAADISLLDIVDAVEGRQRLFRCEEIRRRGPCRKVAGTHFKHICQIARTMHEAEDAYRAVLAGVTLADLKHTVQKEVATEILTPIRTWLSGRVST